MAVNPEVTVDENSEQTSGILALGFMRDSLNSPPLRALGMGMGQLLLSLRPTRVEDSGGVMGEVLSSSQK